MGETRPMTHVRGKVGHGLLVVHTLFAPAVRWSSRSQPSLWTGPPLDLPSLHRTATNPFLFWLLGVVSAISGLFLWCFPLLGRLFGVFSWRHGGVGRTWTSPNATFCLGITLRKPGGLSAPREDPKRRPNQRETHHKKGQRKRETLKMAEQKRDCGSLPAQTAPYTARCPGGAVRRRKDPSQNVCFFRTLCRCNFSP